jgi:hypothetical protein
MGQRTGTSQNSTHLLRLELTSSFPRQDLIVVSECPVCGKEVKENKDGTLRNHVVGKEACAGGRPSTGNSTVEAKARKYFNEGRFKIVTLDEVHVQGSKPEPYIVKWSGTAWYCNCEARVAGCTHNELAKMLFPDKVPVVDLKPAEEDPELDELLGQRVEQGEGEDDVFALLYETSEE